MRELFAYTGSKEIYMKLVFGGLLAMGALSAQDLLVKDAQGQWKQASSNVLKAPPCQHS